MVVYFDSRVPTEWETTHLPIILITGETWNPSKEVLHYGKRSHEDMEMQMIKKLTSGMMRRQAHSVTLSETKMQVKQYGETKIELGKISCVYNPKDFCERLVLAVNVATTYHDNIDKWEDKRKIYSVITNDRHAKATPEELAWK